MELKGSKTEANLWIAFAGESQARNKYDYFASKAKKEGYEQIAAIFQETALNEKEHAKLWFKALDGIGSTEENLVAAAAGENEEWTKMYAEMAKTAEGGGLPGAGRPVRGRGQDREDPRGEVLKAAGQPEEGRGLQEGREGHVVLPQLRPCGDRRERAGGVPGCKHPPGLLPGEGRELLIPPVHRGTSFWEVPCLRLQPPL